MTGCALGWIPTIRTRTVIQNRPSLQMGAVPLAVGRPLGFCSHDHRIRIRMSTEKLTPTVRLTPYRQQLAAQGHCMADDDDWCNWEECPQLRDDEPKRSGRHCPRDHRYDDEG